MRALNWTEKKRCFMKSLFWQMKQDIQTVISRASLHHLFLVQNYPTKKFTIKVRKNSFNELDQIQESIDWEIKIIFSSLSLTFWQWSNSAQARNIIAAVKLNLGEEIVFHLNRVNNGIGPLPVWFWDQIQISTVAESRGSKIWTLLFRCWLLWVKLIGDASPNNQLMPPPQKC